MSFLFRHGSVRNSLCLCNKWNYTAMKNDEFWEYPKKSTNLPLFRTINLCIRMPPLNIKLVLNDHSDLQKVSIWIHTSKSQGSRTQLRNPFLDINLWLPTCLFQSQPSLTSYQLLQLYGFEEMNYWNHLFAILSQCYN